MRYLRLLVPAFALALAASACGGDDGDSADDGNGTGGQGPPEEAALAFNECMRDHGVEIPDAEPGAVAIPGGSDDPAVQQALEECRDLLPEGGGPMAGGEMSPEDLEKLQDYVECMREEGIDMPDPEPDGTLTLPEGVLPEGEEGQARAGGGPPEGMDPEYVAASEACQDHLAGVQVRIGSGPGGGQ